MADAEMADIYARMARICVRRARTTRTRRSSCGGRVLDIRGEDPQALAALADLYDAPRDVGRAGRDPRAPGRGRARPIDEQIALYKHLGRIWEDKLGRERNALDAWLAADRIDGNDLETLRALAHLYRSTQAWDELSPDAAPDHRGRPADRRDRPRTRRSSCTRSSVSSRARCSAASTTPSTRGAACIAIDPSDFRALAALEQLFTREGRWEEAIDVLEKRALVLDDEASAATTLLQAAATWEEKVEDLTARRRRSTSASARPTRRTRPRAIGSRRSTAQQYKWTELVEVLLERVGAARPTSSEQIADPEPGRQDLRDRDRRSGVGVLRAPGRVQARLRARRDRERARAPGHGDQPLAGAARRVHATASTSSSARIAARPRTCGSRSAAGTPSTCQPPRVRDPLGAAGAAHRPEPHRARSAAWPSCSASAAAWSELIETLQRHAAVETVAREEDRPVHPARRAARAADAGPRRRDPRVPAGAHARPARRRTR